MKIYWFSGVEEGRSGDYFHLQSELLVVHMLYISFN
jgi:hypothetical protein